MKISANKLYTFLSVFGFIYFCYVILITPQIEPRWNLFPDVNDYKSQARADLTSSDFYAPKPRLWFSPRPFTVPLFFKIADYDSYKMVMLQKFTYCICVISLLMAILNFITHFWVKLIAQYNLLLFFTWWNIVGWSDLPLSESLSISLMFFWFSSILLYYKRQTILNLLLLLVATLLLSFTRDTWPYIILLFFLLNIFISKFLKIGSIKKSLGLLVFSVCLFFTQSYTSNIGERYKLALFNSIVGRVSKNDDYINWFKNEGMPQADRVKSYFKKVVPSTLNGRVYMCARYADSTSTYKEIFTWIKKDGKKTYQKFLLTHPYYFFLQDLSGEEVEQNLFAYNFNEYYVESEGFFVNADNVFPIFNPWIYLLIFSLLLFLFFKTRETMYIFLIVTFLLFVVNALITYNADSLEVKRHLYITRIVLEFISLTTLLLLTDYISNLVAKKRSNTLNL
ncbi:MAG TPA: hypothetical protein VNX01_08860 [Bacteroidia bacterium]|nr:hypothetical protein [Bacteroidia bacterium]